MCGIAGIYNYDRDKPVDMVTIRRMCDSIAHRGPDNEGFYKGNGIGLGIKRLSIIDLEGGNQPITNETNTIWVVFNGEIYNYRELSDYLKGRGHCFQTNSDTEVLVHGFEEHGEAFIDRLTGMFAFALYDSNCRKLYLVRDRLGIKPLFYSLQRDRMLFGSEIKSILQDPSIERSINMQSLYDFFSYGYIPHPETILENIRQIPPGFYAVIENESFNLRRYWDITFSHLGFPENENISERALELLERSVSRCLISDVPLGLFLSSGIDSNLLLNLIKKQMNETKLRTFTIGYTEKTYDEIPLAKKSALKHQTDHHELYVNAEEFLKCFDRLVWHCDSLLGDFGHILNFKMQEMASRFNKAAIIGAGGDELFVGYPTYQADKIVPYYQAIPRWLRDGIIRRLVNRIPVSLNKLSLELKMKIFVNNAGFEPLRAHYGWKTVFTDNEKKSLLAGINVDKLKNSFHAFSRHVEEKPNLGILDRCLYADLKTWLPEQLYFTDSVSMAHSIENRLPFLDHELVEFAFSIPFDTKMKGLRLKHLLRSTVAPVLPREILNQKKLGAGSPFAVWIADEPKVKEMMMDVLSEDSLKRSTFIDPSFVTNLIDDHLNHKANNGYKIWCLLVFTKWHEFYIEKSPVLNTLHRN